MAKIIEPNFFMRLFCTNTLSLSNTSRINHEITVEKQLENLEKMLSQKMKYDAITSLSDNGFSSYAKHLFDIVKTRPSEPSFSTTISAQDYLPLCSDSAFEYGLYQLKIFGIIEQYISTPNGDFVITFTQKGINLIGKENPLGDKNSKLNTNALILLSNYPLFEKDLETLVSNHIVAIEQGQLVWLKSKKSLVEYFASFGIPNKWTMIERAFNLSNLKSSYHNAIGLSSDYKEIAKIISNR